MDGPGLLALSEERQEQVDAVLARFFSLTKNRAAARGLHPVADTVLGRVR